MIGKHIFLDVVTEHDLTSVEFVERLLREAATEAKATILNGYFHTFGVGQGVTGVLALSESHISIHTWPEYGFAAIDIFMCGKARPEDAADYIMQVLDPETMYTDVILRGGAISQYFKQNARH